MSEPGELERLTLPSRTSPLELVEAKLSRAGPVRLIIEKLEGKVPLIGFSRGAVDALLLHGGGARRESTGGERLPSICRLERLLDALEYVISTCRRRSAGRSMLQLFEAMGEFISPESFERAAPRMASIAAGSRSVTLTSPSWSSHGAPPQAACAGSMCPLDASASETVRSSPPPVCLQARSKLLVDGTEEEVVAATNLMLSRLGGQKLIANLCEGVVRRSLS